MAEEVAATVLMAANTTTTATSPKPPYNTPVLLKDGDPGGGMYGRGGENAVKNGGVGDFSKHWHNTTEMAIVLTVIIVVCM